MTRPGPDDSFSMKQFFLTVAGVFAGLFLFLVVVPFVLIAAAVSSASSHEPVAAHSVLELDLRDGLTDQTPTNPFALFGGSGLSTLQIVDTLAQAADDDRVKVLLIRLPEAGGVTPAAADEIRQAVRRFRRSGKPVIAHSQGFQPVGTSISSYMLGASASELWMQNTASFQVAGFSTDSIFLGRAFDRYGVDAQFEQRYEYKNAVNEFTESDFTPAHREALTAWMNSIYVSAIANAAQDRRLTPQALRAAIEAGPHASAEALRLRLIDKVGHVEEAEAEARRRAGRGAEIVEFQDYASARGERAGSGRNAIAIVSGEGAIMTGTGGADPFGAGSSILSDDLSEAIYDAVEDDAVKAIVFRVSSPGGSPEASEQILAAVRAAKAAGKPVVVSMGDYAASGGYWISSEADWIVAQPGTVTGSIGVFGGKFVLADALGRFGVDMRNLSVGGDYAAAFSPSEPFTAEQRAAFAASIDRTYEEFIVRVSTGRRLPPARVREIARGRVWTGAQARQLGLVDQLGGLEEAIGKARQLARIPDDESVRFKRFPAPESPFQALSKMFGVSGEAARVLVGIGGVMNDPAAEAAVRRIQTERARASGASVLADQPY